MYFMSAGTVRNAISSCRVLFLITLIHIFLGNMLVSHNPSVYVSVATKLPNTIRAVVAQTRASINSTQVYTNNYIL